MKSSSPGRELAQARERLGVGAAGEEPARHVGVGLVLLEPGEELVERGRGHGLDEREQPEVLARIEAHRRRGEEEDAVGRAAERRDRGVERVVREVVRLVHDDEVERDLGGGVDELRVVAERLEGDDRVGERASAASAPPSAAIRSGVRSEKSALNLWKSSASHWNARCSGTTTRTRSAMPSWRMPANTRPASTVLPRPDLVREDEARAADPRGCGRRRRPGAGGRGRATRGARRASRRDGAPRAGRRGCGARTRWPAPCSPAASASSGPPAPAFSSGVSAGTSTSAGSRPETTVTPSRPANRTASAPALVRDLDDHAHAPPALGAVDHLRARFSKPSRRPLTIRTRAGKARPSSAARRPSETAAGRAGTPLTRGAAQARNPHRFRALGG